MTLRACGSLFFCCDKVLLLKTTCQILSFTVQDTHISGTSRRVCCTCTTQTDINSSESPPGFTLLWTPLEEAMSIVLSSCVRDKWALYISSAKYRNIDKTRLHITVIGPCISGRIGTLEYDEANCFVSDFWPPSASLWINRCHSWPLPHVVDDIVRTGCHFVAIGHKLGKHAAVNGESLFLRLNKSLCMQWTTPNF